MPRITLPVTKRFGLEAARMCLADLGWTDLQIATSLREIEWSNQLSSFAARFNDFSGPTASIRYNFEIGFYGKCAITVEVYLERIGRSNLTWKVVSAKAFNRSFPKRGDCTWAFEHGIDTLEIASKDTSREKEVFEIERKSFQPRRGFGTALSRILLRDLNNHDPEVEKLFL